MPPVIAKLPEDEEEGDQSRWLISKKSYNLWPKGEVKYYWDYNWSDWDKWMIGNVREYYSFTFPDTNRIGIVVKHRYWQPWKGLRLQSKHSLQAMYAISSFTCIKFTELPGEPTNDVALAIGRYHGGLCFAYKGKNGQRYTAMNLGWGCMVSMFDLNILSLNIEALNLLTTAQSFVEIIHCSQ